MTSLAVFDLDGTLAATVDVDSVCFGAAIESEFGFTLDADWSTYTHFTDQGIAEEALARHLGRPPDKAEILRLRERFAALLEKAAVETPAAFAPIPGAPELLAHLVEAGWLIVIATGAWRVSAECKIRASALPAALSVFTSDDRPARAAIVAAAIDHAKGVARGPIERIVLVGDGVWDVRTAAQLDLPFLGVASGERATLLASVGALDVVPDFRDLAGSVQSLSAARRPRRIG